LHLVFGGKDAEALQTGASANVIATFQIVRLPPVTGGRVRL
jgi:hypothetical protein